MTKTTNVLLDPLDETTLPQFAKKLNINHHSPTQMSYPMAAWIYRYLVMTQEERRELPSNAAMIAGVCVNNILQKFYADTIWNFGAQRKLTPTQNLDKGKKDEIIVQELERLKNYEAIDEKDNEKKERYLLTIHDAISHGFSALENILGADTSNPIVCEQQISVEQKQSGLLLPIVGRTDFAIFDDETSSSPSFIIELKTAWDKVGKKKKDGTRSFLSASIPSVPSFNHLAQASYYSAVYDFKVPVLILYVTKNGYEIFDKNNCPQLTTTGMKKNFNQMVQCFRRRERLLGQFEELDRELIITNSIDMIDPNFDHPWCWLNMPEEHMSKVRKLWQID